MICLRDLFRGFSPYVNYSMFILGQIENGLSRSDNISEINNASILRREKQLLSATVAGDISLICDLLNSGVSVETDNACFFLSPEEFMTPLQIAAASGNTKVLQCLIEHGANKNRKSKYDITPLHFAAEQGHHDCLKILLDAGAQCLPIYYSRSFANDPAPFHNGTTPLHLAVANNHILCLEHLMKFAASDSTDELGRTVLNIASELGHEECMYILLNNTIGQEMLSIPRHDTGYIPLHFAVEYGMVELVKKMLELGSDVNYQNLNGVAPLHICLASDYSEDHIAMDIVKLLVLEGSNIDVNLLDSDDFSPLQYVAFPDFYFRQPEIARFLIAFGAKINIKNENNVHLLHSEFKFFDSDPSVLKAILDRLHIPPSVKSLFPKGSSKPRWVYNDNRSRGGGRNLENVTVTKEILRLKKVRWYKSEYPRVPKLQHFCRFAIRKAMGYKRLPKVKCLPVPDVIIKYILLGVEV